jgi:hypothetical protein
LNKCENNHINDPPIEVVCTFGEEDEMVSFIESERVKLLMLSSEAYPATTTKNFPSVVQATYNKPAV